MDTRQQARIVQAVYAAFGRGDVPAILPVVTDDVDWASEPESTIAPWHGIRRGKAELPGFFQALGEALEVTEFTPLAFATSDTDVMTVIPDGTSYPWIVKSTGVININQFYFYCVRRFRAVLLKFCSYFPYTGPALHQRTSSGSAQCQAAKAGIGFTTMDNAFAAVDDPAGLQEICDRLGPVQIQALLDKWLAILPNPFTDADTDAGYRYQLSIQQADFSLTQMLDNPVSGRVFFEEVIRENYRR